MSGLAVVLVTSVRIVAEPGGFTSPACDWGYISTKSLDKLRV